MTDQTANYAPRPLTRTEITLVVLAILAFAGSLFVPAVAHWYAGIFATVWTYLGDVLSGLWDLWIWVLNS